MITLVVYLTDGRELSGRYHYLEALARLKFAATLPTYQGFDLTEAI